MGERRGETLSSLLPYLSEGFCTSCKSLLESRLQNLDSNEKIGGISKSNGYNSETSADNCSSDSSLCLSEKSPVFSINGSHQHKSSTPVQTPVKYGNSSSTASVTSRPPTLDFAKLAIDRGASANQVAQSSQSSEEQNELMMMSRVGRKRNFSYIEKVDGKSVNVLQGLELHTQVFNVEEQKKIVDCVYDLQRRGQAGKLRERTYTEPRKWMRGKGRVTIQFGCCYNYAVDKHGNPPGIIRDEFVDPVPPLLKTMIKRLVRWHVLPPSCIPNSCIINIYEEGDCIPPHIDHHDFVRPFCTVSFLTEANILFGTNLKVAGPGEFSGPVTIPLPVGSVLILKGNGADVAKHCVPGVPGKRISITFRKMDDSKLPYRFSPDPELQGLRPLVSSSSMSSSSMSSSSMKPIQQIQPQTQGRQQSQPPLDDDFPPLGQTAVNRSRFKK